MYLDVSERYGVSLTMPDHDQRDMEDAIRTSVHGMTLSDQVMMQIRDSLSTINRKQDSLSQKQDATRDDLVDVRERVIRLEENNRRLNAVEASQKTLEAKVDILLSDKAERAGAQQVVVGFKGWWPLILSTVIAIGTLFTTIYLTGRAAGVISAPPSQGIHPFASERTEVGAGKP